MAADRSEAFDKLRPVCVRLTKEQTSENVLEVLQNVRSVQAEVLQDLQEYVLFPPEIHRQKPDTGHSEGGRPHCSVLLCGARPLAHICHPLGNVPGHVHHLHSTVGCP
ncbi:uncharacterized protein LOC124264231 [Haliotis rubra]|uniref:uncharacterized protein LOC124264231 n=1 Tax=Haliotis rubra TaxID=36100 RepID=UPI001EE56383|nr:uncharacterized protein LOC124264231 [Haliotis rubra]XP_046554925.1 uncharacterized protein LOC124264231 [Haliotis rubra]